MGFFINQGKHKEDDGQFTPIISEKELAQITKVSPHKFFDNSIRLDFRIISEGPNKGKMFDDGVPYLPTDPFAWKYQQVRRAAGVPYKEDEPAEIDIEALLLNKIVPVKLTSHKDKDDVPRQRVKYLKLTNADIAQLNKGTELKSTDATQDQVIPQGTRTTATPTPTIDVSEDDLPF